MRIMHLQNISAVLILVAGIAGACTPRAVSPPLPTPGPTGLPPTDRPALRYLRFSPNTYRYRFQQTVQINAEGSADTVPSTISTRAVVLVVVTSEPDSSIRVTVSFDSIFISTHGSIPSRGFSQVVSLDSVLHTRFSPTGVTVETRLPDSLCAYGQFVSAARELLLPELQFQIESPQRKIYTDTATHQACRAGVAIKLVTTRELQDQGQDSGELALRQQTEIQGAGVLRRDSLMVTGSVSTRGKVSFATGNRLPSLVQTQSEGTIRVQLGSLTTIFSQTSNQEIQLEGLDRR